MSLGPHLPPGDASLAAPLAVSPHARTRHRPRMGPERGKLGHRHHQEISYTETGDSAPSFRIEWKSVPFCSSCYTPHNTYSVSIYSCSEKGSGNFPCCLAGKITRYTRWFQDFRSSICQSCGEVAEPTHPYCACAGFVSLSDMYKCSF